MKPQSSLGNPTRNSVPVQPSALSRVGLKWPSLCKLSPVGIGCGPPRKGCDLWSHGVVIMKVIMKLRAACGGHSQQPAKKLFLNREQLSGDPGSKLTFLHTNESTTIPNPLGIPSLKKRNQTPQPSAPLATVPTPTSWLPFPGYPFHSLNAESGLRYWIHSHRLKTPTKTDRFMPLHWFFPPPEEPLVPFSPTNISSSSRV